MRKLALFSIGVLSAMAMPQPRPSITSALVLPTAMVTSLPLAGVDKESAFDRERLGTWDLDQEGRTGSVYGVLSGKARRDDDDSSRQGKVDGYGDSAHSDSKSSETTATADQGKETKTTESTETSATTSDSSTTSEASETTSSTSTSTTTASKSSNTSPSATTASVSPTATVKNLIPHWDFGKSAIAAAVIFLTIVVAALVFLAFMLYRKARRSLNRRQQERMSYAASSYSAIPLTEENAGDNARLTPDTKSERASLMFSRSRSPSLTFVVEDAGDRNSVTKVYYTNNDASVVTYEEMEALTRTSSERNRSAGVNIAVPEPQYDPHPTSRHRRSSSMPKAIVVVPPPASPVSPLSDAAGHQRSSPSRRDEVSPDSIELDRTRTSTRTNVDRVAHSRQSADSGTSRASRSLLPKIPRSSSPLWRFSES